MVLCVHHSLTHKRFALYLCFAVSSVSHFLAFYAFSEPVHNLVIKLVGFCCRGLVEFAFLRRVNEEDEPFGTDVVDRSTATTQEVDWERFEVDTTTDSLYHPHN